MIPIKFTSQFNLIGDIAKCIKSEYIVFEDYSSYGLNTINFEPYKTVKVNPFLGVYNERVILNSNDISTILKLSKELKIDINLIMVGNKPYIQCNDTIIKCSEVNGIYLNNLMSDRFRILDIKSKTPSYTDTDLRTNQDFENIISMKSADGMSLFRIDKYIMTLFSTLLSINKGDNVQLRIYDIDDTSFLSEFLISKKKFELLTYIRFSYRI